jgi:hypothetical protein
MDPKSINYAARRNLGFYLTLKASSDDNKGEHEMLDVCARVASDRLRELKVRPGNAIKNLGLLNQVISDVAAAASVEATKHGFEDVESNSHAYAASIVFAAMSRYANLMDRRKEREEGEQKGQGKRARKTPKDE